jgi:hypothetical protein
LHFDLKVSTLVFSKTIEELCAPNPPPQSLVGLRIDISDYPKLMSEIRDMVGADINADLADEMSLKCWYYGMYISQALKDVEWWGAVAKENRDNLKSDLVNNVNGKCPQAGLEKSDTAKERVASLNPQLRIARYDRETAKVVMAYFSRLYEGLMKAHYAFRAIVERETQARKSQPNSELPNDIPETNP